MLKTYEFKLQPTRPQEQCLENYLKACRMVYNWALEDRRDLHRYAKCSTNFYDQSKYLVELKKQFPQLKEVHVHALQTALARVQTAFEAFFRRLKIGEKPGYPRFKNQDHFNSFSFKQNGNGFKLEKKRLRLSKIGRVRIRLHREINGKIKTCIVKRKANGWFALFGVEIEPVEPNSLNNPIGLDLGLNSFAVLSNGEKIKNPHFLKKAESDLKHSQRLLSKKKIGSKRRLKQKVKLSRKHLKVECCRKNFLNQTANQLVKKHNPIFVEKLNIKDMVVKNKKAKPKNILDAAWGMFQQKLRSSAESAGSAVIAVEARGTSQECSKCGSMVKKQLCERTHNCACGLVMDRDQNAAKNVLNRGLTKWFGKDHRGEPQVVKLHSANREATPL